MNIIELAREAGFKVDWQHADVAEIKAQRYVAFATAVIAARDAELIAGAGAPQLYDATDDIEGYTREQVAGAVAQANAEIEQLRVQLAGCGVAAMQNTESSKSQRAVKGDYGYSESYADVCRAVDREIEHRERIATLESVLKVALEALNRANTILAELTFSDWIPRTDTPSIDIRQRINATHVIASSSISKCKEVLHAE